MRQFLSDRDFSGGLLTLSGKDFRYLRQVLRLKAGDMVHVRPPSGILTGSTVAKIDDGAKKITLQECSDFQSDLLKTELQPAEKLKEIWLFMFIPKSAKFEQVVRQATECGVSRIFPVDSEFSQKGVQKMNFRAERILKIVREARQQSGSAVETKVEDAVSFGEMCEIWKREAETNPEKTAGIALYERSEFSLQIFDALSGKKIERAALAVGAEGGMSPQEIEKMRHSGFVPVHFRTNVLRCETAAIYGISVLQNLIES